MHQHLGTFFIILIMTLTRTIRLVTNGRIFGKLVASFAIIMTLMAMLSNGTHEYNQETQNVIMLILGGAVALLFSRNET